MEKVLEELRELMEQVGVELGGKLIAGEITTKDVERAVRLGLHVADMKVEDQDVINLLVGYHAELCKAQYKNAVMSETMSELESSLAVVANLAESILDTTDEIFEVTE